MSLPKLELPTSSYDQLHVGGRSAGFSERVSDSRDAPDSDSSRGSSVAPKAHYSPPWANTSIIGIAGSSGSGKTSLSLAIIRELSLPWVVILSMDSFYKPLTPEQSGQAFRNEYDFDAPEAIDFDFLVEKLRDIKTGKKADIPIYSFEKHARLDKTNTIYSPHVLVLEGIFALHDERVMDLLDLKIFTEADADLCLSRRLLRDVRERGRDIEGCIKQWFSFVKPNFHKFVEPQRNVADIIVPRGIENKVAISMVCDRVHKTLDHKSQMHRIELKRLGKVAEDAPLSHNVVEMEQTNQVRGINTMLMDPSLIREEFIFYFDRLVVMLVEQAFTSGLCYKEREVETPVPGRKYEGLAFDGEVSAVVVLRGGSCLETGLKRVIPDCRIGRMLIQSNPRTTEPELHYYKMAPDVASHKRVLVLDPQMSSGGAALMAVRVLLDHGVEESSIVFVTYSAGRNGLQRLMSVFPGIRAVVCRIVEGDIEVRWVEQRYLGC
ncbi:Uridine kinase [Fulvia fulva]|uniref:Uridine kinase n=1 Tax=Passalora fulva TaxID=5499 RepID=A0A9Q8USU9_PASFU|nr:Uridine kinase [Fulvia fulva]KAK4617903.1 Uridine kinase [Fulvia fulva]KAK4619051.1 Uridine kinase [Fulvia fulva]UJO21162.1 Uridine kinase [Fulvia fulva]WPV17952.1 Uridine kinase [Fulvia fulva]WPV33322.1 Uridine kinase [Fulvia fulva]